MRSRVKSARARRVGAVGKPQALGMLNGKCTICSASEPYRVQQFEAHRNQFFTDIYQFVVVTARTDS